MGSSPQQIPLPVSPVAGVKRPAPSLLPAFEPFFSSPQLPRSNKRFAHASPSKSNHIRERSYPTPIPSSSTIISSSSPPKAPYTRRLGLTRTLSTVSERSPLSIVPTLELSEHGEPTLMGRSSNSSHYQLSTNKLISRVHVKATYVPADPPARKKVRVECTGWNGVRIHCTGRTHDLERGQIFTSEIEGADIMVDVQDARVLLAWPKHESKVVTPTDSESSWGSPDNSPSRAAAATRNRAPSTSPLRQQRLQSPVSPSPAVNATHARPSGHFASDPPVPVPVQVYEDEAEDEKESGSLKATQSTQFASQPLGNILQELQASPSHHFESDNDEENDPIISSFSGPYGPNLTANMESFTTRASPRRRPLDELKEESVSPQCGGQAGVSPKRRRRNDDQDVSSSLHNSFYKAEEENNPITNHVISQLTYSRLSSIPISTLMQTLPVHLKAELDNDLLISLLDGSPCIGEVAREGKDAAGKRLESEYYYIPEGDADESRREMVEGLGGRGLRNCRKSHKVPLKPLCPS